MTRYHVNNDGNVHACTAQTGNCPFGGAENHHASEAEARRAYEVRHASFSDDVRKLVTLRTVGAVQPIENADAIEAIVIDGWRVVVKKGEFAPNDAVIYMELDSALPIDDSRFAFLEPRGVKEIEGRRYHVLKSAKLRGVVSQGIAFHPDNFPEIKGQTGNLAPLLQIIKYEPPLPAGNGAIIGRWDPELQKTDSERVQNLAVWLPTANPAEWRATVKVDGTSSTIRKTSNGVHVFSRNYEVNGEDMRLKAAERFELLSELQEGQAVQFELAGPGINGNRQKLKDLKPFVFTVTDRNGEPLPREQWPASLAAHAVPEITLPMETFTVENLMELSDNLRGSITKDVKDEGIVFHHREGKRFRELGDRDTFKAVSDKYLLKHGE